MGYTKPLFNTKSYSSVVHLCLKTLPDPSHGLPCTSIIPNQPISPGLQMPIPRHDVVQPCTPSSKNGQTLQNKSNDQEEYRRSQSQHSSLQTNIAKASTPSIKTCKITSTTILASKTNAPRMTANSLIVSGQCPLGSSNLLFFFINAFNFFSRPSVSFLANCIAPSDSDRLSRETLPSGWPRLSSPPPPMAK